MSKKEILKLIKRYGKKYNLLPLNIMFHYFKGNRAKYLAGANEKHNFIDFNLKYFDQIEKSDILHELGHLYYPCYYKMENYNKGVLAEYYAEKFMLDNCNKKEYKRAIEGIKQRINSELWKQKFDIHCQSYVQLLADKGELYE